RTLRQHQDIQAAEARLVGLDSGHVGDIHLCIVQPFQIRTFGGIVLLSARSRSPDMNFCTVLPKSLSDTVTDTAGAAHYENCLAAEIQFIHCVVSRRSAKRRNAS